MLTDKQIEEILERGRRPMRKAEPVKPRQHMELLVVGYIDTDKIKICHENCSINKGKSDEELIHFECCDLYCRSEECVLNQEENKEDSQFAIDPSPGQG